MKLAYVLSCVAVVLSAGCTPVADLVAAGEFERAYELARKRVHHRMERDKPPRGKRVAEFRLAYDAVQGRDLRRVAELEARPGTEKHEELYYRYRALHTRSVDYRALDPTRAPSDSLALTPSRLLRLRDEAGRRAGAHYLSRARPLLTAVERGDKPAAREAFGLYDQATYFLPDRLGALVRVMDTLYEVGTLRIHLRVAPGGDPEASRRIERALGHGRELRRGWTSVVTTPGTARVDLVAAIRYERGVATAPDESCSTTTYDEEVLDYVEEKKVRECVDDSTVVERVVEIEHFETVYASVTECEQTASARAYGTVRVFAPGKAVTPQRLRLAASETWEHTYEVYDGDARALPMGCRIPGSPAWPPSRDELLAKAQHRLGGQAWGAVARAYAPSERDLRRRRRRRRR